jgi:threonine-phosphate decarboxylase
MIQGHGGNLQKAARRLGVDVAEILDFSSNVNPLGPPDGLCEHLAASLDAIVRLPEVDALQAEAAFAGYHGLAAEQVIADSGTTQFIYALPAALEMRRVLVVAPTYADYADGCRRHSVRVRHHLCRAEDGFVPDLDRLDQNLNACDAAVICNPNNPTGVLVDGDRLAETCARHPRVRFVIDESYLPFCEAGETHSMIARGLDNVLVLSSFSKIYRIPGLRIGFLVAPPRWVKPLRARRLPWSVNGLAIEAVSFLSAHAELTRGFIRATRAYLQSEKRYLTDALSAVAPVDILPSTTAFMLMRLPADGPDAATVASALARQAMLIRDCANFQGLTDRHIRLSVQHRAANRQLVAALAAILAAPRNPPPAPGGRHVA